MAIISLAEREWHERCQYVHKLVLIITGPMLKVRKQRLFNTAYYRIFFVRLSDFLFQLFAKERKGQKPPFTHYCAGEKSAKSSHLVQVRAKRAKMQNIK